MGRLFLIDYDQTHDTKFYLCRTCHAHISLAKNLTYTAKSAKEGSFKRAVNVLVDGPEHYRRVPYENRSFLEADVQCNKCLCCLGWQYWVEDEDNPGTILHKGGLILRVDRLMLWNGTDIVDVDLQIPDSDEDEDDHVDIVVCDD